MLTDCLQISLLLTYTLAVIMTTVIIADSRGSGLQQLLFNMGCRDLRILTHPGAGYELAALRSVETIKVVKPDLILVLTGICDLTRRDFRTKVTQLRHPTIMENVEHVINSAKSSLDLLKSLGDHRISFSTITGIDLADYNNPTRKYMTDSEYREYCLESKITHPQQDTLNLSILEINRRITALNRANSTPTVWLGGVVHSHSKRKTYHYYIRLMDGCHADEHTKTEWASQIHNAILRMAVLQSHQP